MKNPLGTGSNYGVRLYLGVKLRHQLEIYRLSVTSPFFMPIPKPKAFIDITRRFSEKILGQRLASSACLSMARNPTRTCWPASALPRAEIFAPPDALKTVLTRVVGAEIVTVELKSPLINRLVALTLSGAPIVKISTTVLTVFIQTNKYSGPETEIRGIRTI